MRAAEHSEANGPIERANGLKGCRAPEKKDDAMDRASRGYRAKFLLGLLLFNGITAVGGGLALMTGWITEQPSWVQHTDFSSL